MNKFVFLVLYVSALLFQPANAQVISSDGINPIVTFKDTPQEQVYVHYNSSLLFTGEYLYYKIYCLTGAKLQFSSLSTVAYVELVSEDKTVVFRHKIKLTSGKGQGDFFIPTSVASGNYKLIGYTQWMRNSKRNKFFQSDIAIINPYQGDQKKITRAYESPEKQLGFLTENNQVSQSDISSNEGSNVIRLFVDQKQYGKRKKVSLKINHKSTNFSNSYTSLSVRKIDTINVPVRTTANVFTASIDKMSNHKVDLTANRVFFPELRGWLFSGKIVTENPKLSMENKKVILSVPGKSYDLKMATTNDDGSFFMNIDKPYVESEAFIQVLGDNDKFSINIDQHVPMDYKGLKFENNFYITSDMKQMILDRSVYNQINNGYFNAKPDTINLPRPIVPFYGEHLQAYNLDDYTRFPTVKETVVEIVENVRTKKIGEEKFIFLIKKEKPVFEGSNFLPLVIVDGLMIQDHTDVVTYNANNVEKISYSRIPYFISSQIFQGVLDIKTNTSNFYEKYTKSYLKKIKLFTPEPKKNYFIQSYDGDREKQFSHVPDFRQQLLWLPDLKLDKEETNINFYTSDNTGSYEICLEGFNEQGKPISVKKVFRVE
ncbi:hypothetical protein D1816_00340 [Aquimarina sp. AD10]|uniref:hypothetical protein n=1 Tax=Aquimarina sp. AD10 TaxID=1714849 RepID=UPI000E4743B8|nr:hypothetical protein [Aquimarina sp. AD10]AXT58860.1 hypothetical protein D1816_00340 [Aquimarina sp. AD10]RKM99665.1 hypothetical protein D7033_10875 [Aquimarina sp. AD10]